MSGALHGVIASLAGRVTDTFWKYVSLLLNTTSTNGAQNNTFLDSSTNNFTVTRNGDTTQGSFNPYMPSGYWSGYFDGNGDQLDIANNAAFEIGSGDFCYEAWVYATRQTNTFAQGIINYGIALNTGSSTCDFQISNSGYLALAYATGASLTIVDTTLFPINQWVHAVACRTGSTISLFVNGARTATATTSATVGTGGAMVIGGEWYQNATTRQLQGYISNARVIKGSHPYDATQTTLTVPTAPLTAIANTSLLCLQDNRFIDRSANNFTITVNGDTRISKLAPFNPPASYSTASYGGSGYFDGTGDTLSLASNAAFDLASSNFTLEAWIYQTSGTLGPIINRRPAASATGWLFSAGEFSAFINGAWRQSVITATVTNNVWLHVALVRNGSTFTLYHNGTSVGTYTQTGAVQDLTQAVVVGAAGGTTEILFTGYIANARMVVGTAVYIANFTPPTTPLTAITNTSLLLNFTNAGIYDAATINDGQTVGNAQVSTTQAKWGTTSLAFDGTGDYLTVIDKPELRLGSGDFTIEGWVYLSATGVAYGLVSKGTATTGWSVNVTSGNKLQFSYTASNLTGATSLASGTWYYFAVTRSGTAAGNLKVFLNGSADATSAGAVTDNFNQTNVLYVGADRVAGAVLNGYLQDVRVTNGYARTITTPTAAFPTL